MVESIIIGCVITIILIKLSEYKISIRKNTTSFKKDEGKSEKKGKRVGRVGKSMPDIRQMMTLNDSCLETDNEEEKGHIFDSSKDESEPEPKDLVIDADPTETVVDEQEDIAVYTGEEVYTAGGMDYDVMMNTVGVINSKTASKEEEQKAGKVLYDNRNTELVDKMVSAKGELSVRITSLIGLRLQQHAEENAGYVESGLTSHLNESEEYKNFNANDYF
ncbi:hypothetical protein [Dysgonomonas sp. 520]|uniref:hypothetical protein n=1 Tax=Dysgonomonas sp. 520 TaxID=2302931 RepID=UPI0013D59B33|nr:hypothetical protein [Dysgonomonas sp. 520]MDL2302811.1 hypothetical protein [Dysgonomonas sp. OttesenSCG-928-D17]NDW10219.1 hypothetical protein [Dysgonomonas sp. 520]